MGKSFVYTIITPLPSTITRETVLAAFHDHALMIEVCARNTLLTQLNPLVLGHSVVKPPRWAPADEFHSTWYEIEDRVNYLGAMVTGKIKYHACCHNLRDGLQTHCYAAMGVDIRGKWLLRGSLPGEPQEDRELGIAAPPEGLYIREDIVLKCNFMVSSIVKRNLKAAHTALLDRLIVGAGIVEETAFSVRPDGGSASSWDSVKPVAPMAMRESMQAVLEGKQRRLSPSTPALSLYASQYGSLGSPGGQGAQGHRLSQASQAGHANVDTDGNLAPDSYVGTPPPRHPGRTHIAELPAGDYGPPHGPAQVVELDASHGAR